MTHQFAQPSSGNFFKPADRNGHLILIVAVSEIGERFDNLSGRDKPFAVMDLVDLDDPNPALQLSVTDNHPGIVNKVKTAHRTGEMVLGRIGQVATEKANAAWVLGPFTPGADDVRASQWLTANPINQFGQPAAAPPPAPAPAPQPVQQAPAAPGPIAALGQQFAARGQAMAAAAQAQQAPAPQALQQAAAPYTTPAGPNHPVQQAYNAAQQAPAPAPVPQPAPAAPAAPQGLPPGIDPANLTPEVIALLQNLPQQQ